MKKILLLSLIILIASISCSPKGGTDSTSITKEITLQDAPEIIELSTLLPERFEQIDPATEKLSNKDLGLGPDFSEVQLYLSSEPFQMIYGAMGIIESKVESAMFDTMLNDENQIKQLITENIIAGAKEAGSEATVPDIKITHPSIGDSSILGEGVIESSGFYFGFDTCWVRMGNIYVFYYSLYLSEDKISLDNLFSAIEKRIADF